MKFSKKSTHITLCKTMADGLKKNYSLPENSISIISNAAFLKNPTATSGKTRWKDFSPNESVCIGFLSNITTSKGIFEYFETLKEIKAKKINFSAYIAGPIFEPEIMTKFKLELDDMPEVVYLGGIYGEAKTQFFHKIDILLFPTNYINEAEPVTIHEAMHEGVLVCAANRGCISKIIPADCGCTASFESFKKVAVETIIEFSKQDKILKATRRELIKNTAAKIWSESNEDLKKLVHKISIK